MAKTVVGLFEQERDAQAAQRELEAVGLGSDTTTFVSRHEADLTSRLMEAGVPQQDAQLFADGVGQGNRLIVVQGIADADAEQAAAIMDRHHVVDLSRRLPTYQRMSLDRTVSANAAHTAQAGAMPTNLYEGQDLVLPIVEEQLRIGKRAVERGGVRIRTHVKDVPVNEQVTLRDETVAVERVPVNRAVTDADLAAMHDDTIEVHETDEEAVVDKQARVVEDVVVRKDAQERTETIQDSVRRTQVDVDEVAGQTTTSGTARSVGSPTGSTVDVATASTTMDEGAIERGASKLGNAVERATGADIDRDGDVGRRDPRNNV